MCVRISKVKGNDSVSKVAVFFKRERFIGWEIFQVTLQFEFPTGAAFVNGIFLVMNDVYAR